MDALGNPLRIILSEGQRADITQAVDLVAHYQTDALLADRGYDADSLIELLKNKQIEVVVRAKKNCLDQREIDENLYKDHYRPSPH